MAKSEVGQKAVIDQTGLQNLFDALNSRGYRVIGPRLKDEAIVYDELSSVTDLPIGWTDEQDGGHYRLKKRNDAAFFGYAVGPHSWKQFLYPPRSLLWRAKRKRNGFVLQEESDEHLKFAFFGVRSCELHAIAIQDKVFLEGAHGDSQYQSRRKDLFTVAVNCGQAGGTCFCVSMGTGPKATHGFDLAMTEVLDEDSHFFLVEVGTSLGAQVLEDVPHVDAGTKEVEEADQVSARTKSRMGRTLETSDIKELLYRNTDHPRWEEVASRCLTCGNCTLVCPTCFCSTVEDVTDLTGDTAERWRSWDSCFTTDFSYIHGGSIRATAKARYRQWMTHKLATWIDQFGTSGCVGCGRCITWCPVGIDLTEEAGAIRNSDGGKEDDGTDS